MFALFAVSATEVEEKQSKNGIINDQSLQNN